MDRVGSWSRVLVGLHTCQRPSHLHFLPAFSEAEAMSFVWTELTRDGVGARRGVLWGAAYEEGYLRVKSYLLPKPREVLLADCTEEGIS